MRIHPRVLCTSGLLATLVAFGCQPAPLVAPAGVPRGIRIADALELTADTDLSVSLTRGCAESYAVQQLPEPLDPRVSYFLLLVSGPNLPGGRMVRIPATDFTGRCLKVVHLDDLLPGRYHVVLDGRDGQGNYVGGNEGDVTVTRDGVVAGLTLRCQFTGGFISPTPWPSPSPVPTATPTPSPVPPSPTPNACLSPNAATYPAAQVPNPALHFDRVHGLHADILGRVYLFGLRPQPWTDAYEFGRLLRVDQQGALVKLNQRSLFAGSELVTYEVEYFESKPCSAGPYFGFIGAKPRVPNYSQVFPAQSANHAMIRADNGSQSVSYLNLLGTGDFVRPWGASAPSGAAGLHIGSGQKDPAKLAGYMIVPTHGGLAASVDRMHLTGGRAAAVERPLAMIMDRVRGLPVWTSKRGVLTVAKANKPKDPPRVLINRPVYGITRIAGVPINVAANRSNQVLLTTYTAGEQDVYYADLDAHQGTPAQPAQLKVAFHFNAGIPHRIERGADGLFYVLLQQGPLPADAASGFDPYFHEYPGTNQIRVVQLRYDAVNKRLYDPRLVADSFTDPTPSF